MAMLATDVPRRGGDVAARVLRYVRGHEGAHFREILRNVGLATGQADHHLRRLVRAGLLVRTPLGHEVHFFPASRPPSERKPRAALLHPARRAAAMALLGEAPMPLAELARRTGLPDSTLRHHLHTMLQAGVVFRVEERRRVAYGLSDPAAARAMLAASAPGPAPAAAPPAAPAGAPAQALAQTPAGAAREITAAGTAAPPRAAATPRPGPR